MSEVSNMEFEATLCGCLLVKIGPEAFASHSDILGATEGVTSLASTVETLGTVLSDALKVMRQPL